MRSILLTLLTALVLTSSALAQSPTLAVAIMDTDVTSQGEAVIDIQLTGFSEVDSLSAWQFELPLPDGVQIDSLGVFGTLSAGSGGRLEFNVVTESTEGLRVLFAAYATTGNLVPGDAPLVRVHAQVASDVDALLGFRRFLVNRTELDSFSSGSLRGYRPTVDASFQLVVRDANADSLMLFLGYDAAATPGFDEGLDVAAPPPPPNGFLDARLIREDRDYYSDYQPAGLPRTQWTLAATDGAYPITVSWDPAAVPFTGSLQLEDTFGGVLVSLDMRTESSLVLQGGGIRLTTFTITNQIKQKRPVTYTSGWNMVGLPLRIPHQAYQQIFSRGIDNQMFGFRGAYANQDTLAPGQGYWLRMSEAVVDTLEGDPIDSLNVLLQTGWNMVAGVNRAIPVETLSDPHSVLAPGSVFGFEGAYSSVDSLLPGYGYWIRAVADGMITIGGEFGAAKASFANAHSELDAFTRIDFNRAPSEEASHMQGEADWSDRRPLSTLYFAPSPSGESGGADPEAHRLPPLPPSGVFDARFVHEGILSLDDQVEIQIQGHDGDVRLQITTGSLEASRAVPGPDWTRSTPSAAWKPDAVHFDVTQRLGPIELSVNTIAAGEPLAIDPRTTGLTVSKFQASADAFPSEFTLDPNAPNPFNPSTSIHFTLPVRSNVNIEVLTLLGQRVATLVDAPLAAGRHQVVFHAESLSSGVYVYRIRTDQGFSASRRMLLLK